MTYVQRIRILEETKNALPSLLLIGNIDESLEQFASKVLQECDKQLKTIQVYTSNRLPMAGETADDSLFVSLVVFLVDVGNKISLQSAKTSLQFLPLDFFMGRLVVLGLNITTQSEWCVSPEEISLLGQEFDCPVLWGDLTEHSCNVLISQVLRKLEILTRYPTCATSALSLTGSF